jgi:hypothetical protein
LKEGETPSGEKEILAAFNADDGVKFSPTVEFLRNAYGILNQRLFGGKLPRNLVFSVESRPSKRFVGLAKYTWRYDPWDHTLPYVIVPKGITLNGSVTLSLHEWLNVVLHEMVHILDYQTNPEHFQERQLRRGRRSYDAHGGWFLEQGRKFDRFGFNIQKYCNAEMEMNTDDRKVRKAVADSVFLLLKQPGKEDPYIMKVKRNTLEKHVQYLRRRILGGTFPGVGEFYVVSGDNPMVARLKTMNMRNVGSKISFYFYNNDFVGKFGPFKTERVVPVERDELSEEEENGGRLDPEEVKDEIYNSVENVANVKQTGEGEFEVSIP